MAKQIYDSDIEVHDCTFQGYFIKAKLNLRFPCSFFIEWRGLNGKQLILSANKYKAKNGLIEFNESLAFSTQMLWDRNQRTYLRKDSIVKVNLVSASRPDQVKLVGQLTLDLAQVANAISKQIEGSRKLAYCSVDAELMFDVKVTEISKSQKYLADLDKSSFNIQTYSMHCGVRANQRERSKSRSRQILERVASQGRFAREKDFSLSSMNPLHSSRTRTIRNEFIVIEQDHSRLPSTFKDEIKRQSINLNSSGMRNSIQSPRESQMLQRDPREQRSILTQKYSVETQEVTYSPREKLIERSSEQVHERSRENYDKMMAENTSLKGEFTKYEMKIQILEENMKALSKQLQEAKIRRQVDRISNESKEKALLQRRVQEVESKLRLKESQLDMKAEEIKALSQKLDNMSQEYSVKQNQLRDFISKSSELEVTLQEMKFCYETIKLQKESQISVLQQELQRANDLVKQMDLIKNGGDENGRKLPQRILLLEAQVKEKEQMFKEDTESLNEKKQEVVDLKNGVREIQSEALIKDKRIFYFEAALGESENVKAECQGLSRQLQQIKGLNERLKCQNDCLRGQNEQVKLQNGTLKSLNEKLKKQLDIAKSLPEQKITQPNPVSSQTMATARSEQLIAMKELLQNQLKQLEDLNKQKDQEMTTLNEENLKLQLQVMGLQQSMEELKKQNQSSPQKTIPIPAIVNQQKPAQTTQTINKPQQKTSSLHQPQIQLDYMQQLTSKTSQLDELAATHKDALQKIKQYQVKISYLQRQLSKTKDQAEQCPKMNELQYKQHQQDLELDHLDARYQQEHHNTWMLDVKINVNEVASVDESHHSQDHVYVLTEDDYLPSRERKEKAIENDEKEIKIEHNYDMTKKDNQEFGHEQQPIPKSSSQIQAGTNKQLTLLQRESVKQQIEPFSKKKQSNTLQKDHMDMALLRQKQLLERQVDQLRKNQANLQSHSQRGIQQQAKVTELSEKIKQLEALKLQLQGQNVSLKQQLIVKEQKCKSLLRQKQQKQREVEESAKKYEQIVSNRDEWHMGVFEGRIIELEEELKMKDELLNEMEENVKDAYNLKFELAQVLQVKKQLQQCLKLKEQRINQLEEITMQLNKNIEATPITYRAQIDQLDSLPKTQPQTQQTHNQEVQKVTEEKCKLQNQLQAALLELDLLRMELQKATQANHILQTNAPLERETHANDNDGKIAELSQQNLHLSLKNNELQQMIGELKQQNILLNEDMKLARSQILQVQEECLSNKELAFKLEQQLHSLKQQCVLLQTQNSKLLQKSVVLQESNLAIKQQLELHSHSSEIRQRKNSLSLSTSNKLVELELPPIDQFPQKNQTDCLTEVRHSVQNSQTASKQQYMAEAERYHFQSSAINQHSVVDSTTQNLQEQPPNSALQNNAQPLQEPNTQNESITEASFKKKQSEVNLCEDQAVDIPLRNQTKPDEKLQHQVTDLRNELDILREELISESNQHTHLKHSFTQHQQRLNQSLNQIQQLTHQKQSILSQYQQELAANASMKQKMVQVEDEMMRIQQDFNDYQEVCQDQINNWIISKDQTYAKPKSTNSLTEIAQNLRKQNHKLNQQIKLLIQKNAALDTNCSNAKTELQLLKQAMTEIPINTAIPQPEENQNIIQAKQPGIPIEQLQVNSDRLQNQLSELSEQFATLKNDKTLVQKDKQNLERENEELNQRLLQIHEKWLVLQKQKSDLSDENKGIEGLIKQSEDEINSLKLNIRQLEDQANILKLATTSLSSELNCLKPTLNAKDQNIQQLEARILQLQQLLQGNQGQSHQSHQQIHIMKEQLHTLHKQLEQADAQLQARLGSKQQVAILQQQLESQQLTIHERQCQVMTLRQQLQQKNNQLIQKARSYSQKLAQQQQLTATEQGTNKEHMLNIHKLQSSLQEEKLKSQLSKQSQQAFRLQKSSSQQQRNSLQDQYNQLTTKHAKTHNLLLEVEEQVLKDMLMCEQMAKEKTYLLDAIKKHQSREEAMKEHLAMLEEESRGIFAIVKEKEIESERLYQAVAELEDENGLLRVEMGQLEELVAHKDGLLNCYQNSMALNKLISSNNPQLQGPFSNGLVSNSDSSQTSILKKLQKRSSAKQVINGRELNSQTFKPIGSTKEEQNGSVQEEQNGSVQEEQMDLLIVKNQQLINHNKELLEMLSRKNSLAVENKKLKTLADSKQTQINAIKSQLIDLKSKLINLKSQLLANNTINQSIAQLKASNLELLKQKNDLESQLKSSKSPANNSHSKPKILIHDGSQMLQKLIEDKNAKVQTANNNLKLAQDLTRHLKSINQQLNQQIYTLKQQLNSTSLNQLQLHSKINQLQLQLTFNSKPTHCLTSAKDNPQNLVLNDQPNSHSDDLRKLNLIIAQLNLLQSSRNTQSDREKLISLLLQKRYEQQDLSDFLNSSNNKLKQKARTVSKEIQKIKSLVIKNPASSIEDKTKLIASIKNCQTIVSDLVKITQQLKDPQFSIHQ